MKFFKLVARISYLMIVLFFVRLCPMVFTDEPAWNDLAPIIVKMLDFTSLVNLKKTCKICNVGYSIDTLVQQSDVMASSLMSNDNLADKVLVAYARKKNKSIFERLWNIQTEDNKKKRISAVSSLYKAPNNDLHELMRAYRGKSEAKIEKAEIERIIRNNNLKKVVRAGEITTAKILLSNGADPKTLSSCGDSLLYIAVQKGKVDIILLLIASGIDINYQGLNNGAPLHCAVSIGNRNIVRILCENGAAINQKNYCTGEIPLHVACEKGHDEIVSYLLQQGSLIDVEDCWGNTPLNMACSGGWLRIIKLLLSNNALATIGKDNRSLVFWHSKHNYDDIIALLNSYGAHPCLEERIIKEGKSCVNFFIFALMCGIIEIFT